MQGLSADQLAQAALQCHSAGKLREAEGLYRKLLAHRPRDPDLHYNLACALQEMRRLPEALISYDAAVSLRSNWPEAHNNRGMVLHRLGRLNDAAAAFAQAVACRPDYSDAHYHLGRVLEDSGRQDEALEAYGRAVSVGSGGLATNRGSALRKVGRLDEAVAAFQDALRLRESADIRLNLGAALQEQGEVDCAIAEYRRAIKLRPQFPESYVSLASGLRELGRVDEAIAACEQALQIRSDDSEAAWNLGLLKLLKGEFAVGWALYESRLRLKHGARTPLSQPGWDGSHLNGRRILVDSEQGFGDTIQFARYLPMLAEIGGRVILRCQPALTRLFALNGFDVIAETDPLPAFDIWSPLMSLPRLLGTRLESIPARVPYLSVDRDLASKWKRMMGQSDERRIGLVWAGSRGNANDRNRSIDPTLLAALRDVPGVRYFSLQKHDHDTSPRLPPLELIDFTPQLADFAETAGLVGNLDLVISVDTAVAHLAGAMGKPVCLLLPFAPDWRWMLERTDSPWYPGMRLFRQPARGDWHTPIARIVDHLVRQGPRP